MADAAVTGRSSLNETLHLSWRILRGRWFMVFASFLIMSVSGGTYIYAIYSPVIKSVFGYDQKKLNTLSFAMELGANVGIVAGLLNEVTPPWAILAAGSAMNLAGYLPLYLSLTGRIAQPRFSLMCLSVAVGANSQTFTTTAVLVTMVKNFPGSRAAVLGLLKGYVGLSGAILTQVYIALDGQSNPAYLVLLIAWLPSAVSAVFAATIRKSPSNFIGSNLNEISVFRSFLYISVFLAGHLLVVIVLENELSFSRQLYCVSAAVIILLLLLPLAVVIKEEIVSLRKLSKDHDSVDVVIVDDDLTAVGETPDDEAPRAGCLCLTNTFRGPKRGEDHNVLQAILSLDMLILAVGGICGLGGATTAISNLAQIGESLGYPLKNVTTFVSIVSIWNYVGLAAAGFSSEALYSRYKISRPLLLAVVLIMSCSGHLIIAFGAPKSLYIASVITGFCLGAQIPLFFATISEIFGLKYFSTLYSIGGLASPLAAYLMSVVITGHFYDLEASKQQNETCIGVGCFKVSFLIITGLTAVGAVAMAVLAYRTREFYKSDIYARFRVNSRKPGDEAAEAGEEEEKKKVAGRDDQLGEDISG